MDRRPLRSSRGEQKTERRPLPDNPFASVTGLYRRRSPSGSAWPERTRRLPVRLMHLLLLVAVVAVALILFVRSDRSSAYLSDEDTVQGNSITLIDATPTPNPTETPTATPTTEEGVGVDIVTDQEPTPCPTEPCETPEPPVTEEPVCSSDDPASCLPYLPDPLETIVSPIMTRMPTMQPPPETPEPTEPPASDDPDEPTGEPSPDGDDGADDDDTVGTSSTSGTDSPTGDDVTPTPTPEPSDEGGVEINDEP